LIKSYAVKVTKISNRVTEIEKNLKQTAQKVAKSTPGVNKSSLLN
jgi:hypothetical protein